jgi:hypothetical protein
LPNRFYRFTVALRGDNSTEVRVEQYASLKEMLKLPQEAILMGLLPSASWQVITNTFWTYSRAALGRAVTMLNQFNGHGCFDDFKVELLPATTPFSLGSGVGVDLRGHPSIMGMRIIGASLAKTARL